MIIWRGFGIAVFIIFCICAWIMSYYYEDTRLGNGLYMGWSMIWAAGPTLLLYMALRSFHLKDKELAPGEIAEPKEAKSKIFTGHTFFFLPVVFWPFIFLGLGLYFVNTSGEDSSASDYTANVEDDVSDIIPEGELIINFWNPNEDTTSVTTYYDNGEERMHEVIPPNYIRFATYDAGIYSFETDDYQTEIIVNGGDLVGDESYKQGWYILDPNIDLILVDVTDICADVMEVDVRAIDWAKKIEKRFEGGQLMVPEFISGDAGNKYSVIDPGWEIPVQHEENEKVYALVPIEANQKATDEFLDNWFVKL